MSDVRIEGNKNIANTGIIQGDCIIKNTTINMSFKLIELNKIATMEEKEKSLINMTEAQSKLAGAIETFAQAELMRAEADKLRAKADENNSLANLNYSKVMLEDREIIKQMLNQLK
ncbi:hypothetical protein [Bacteroides propionicifaciens]|uniref:hypothetical protein n=1 Tax=Bacteroides propionicifaciens TaxID=392838 RepID=UPI000379C929|nr:hypothetical protein [Bacteroides propionicifaciens]